MSEFTFEFVEYSAFVIGEHARPRAVMLRPVTTTRSSMKKWFNPVSGVVPAA